MKKTSNSDSQNKKREYLKAIGKESITDYIEPDTKAYLVGIQKQYGYKRLGDAIDFVVNDYKKLRT